MASKVRQAECQALRRRVRAQNCAPFCTMSRVACVFQDWHGAVAVGGSSGTLRMSGVAVGVAVGVGVSDGDFRPWVDTDTGSIRISRVVLRCASRWHSIDRDMETVHLPRLVSAKCPRLASLTMSNGGSDARIRDATSANVGYPCTPWNGTSRLDPDHPQTASTGYCRRSLSLCCTYVQGKASPAYKIVHVCLTLALAWTVTSPAIIDQD